ncbi:MAG: CDP-glucose 4,6-dehydratase, partial [Armatimonadetes bacterium]|nr:CDP-glucose 4,6-dehydratase [Armatimonadota bacterium]
LFHLAAQPLVRRSYSEPALTFETNVLGSLNLLEALRAADRKCVAVFITSDKCYDNVEQVWGYRETDRLGGKDPYSGSKGAAELVIRSYAESFFKKPGSPVRIAVGRAGNVIGGGDWAKDRIVPDAIQAWHNKTALQVRRPSATRPWQHVLEPLSGYLTLATLLAEDEGLNGEAFNFGPPAEQVQTVGELLDEMIVYWPDSTWQDASTEKGVYEAGLLKLCCDKALHRLLWKPTLSFYETVQLTSQWYRMFYSRTEAPGDAAWECTQDQIARYEALARDRGVSWAT